MIIIFVKRKIYIEKSRTIADLKEMIRHEIVPSNDSMSYTELTDILTEYIRKDGHHLDDNIFRN